MDIFFCGLKIRVSICPQATKIRRSCSSVKASDCHRTVKFREDEGGADEEEETESEEEEAAEFTIASARNSLRRRSN